MTSIVIFISVFKSLHFYAYYFINILKRFSQATCCHEPKRKILLEMVKNAAMTNLRGEGILKTQKYYTYSVQFPHRLLLKVFLWFS